MITLLTNSPAPLALRVDLVKLRNPRPPPLFPELIFKLHKIIANPKSRAEEVKIAKRVLLGATGQTKQSPEMAETVVAHFAESQHTNPRRGLSKTTTWRAAHASNYRRCHETNQN